MAISKVDFFGNTLINISGDTVDAAHLAQGYTAHDKQGNPVVGTMSGGGGSPMNVQVAQSTTRANSSTYTELVSLTCNVSGTYDIYWSCYRSSTSGTSGSQLYIDNTASGSANTTFTNHVQNNHRTGVSLTAGQEVAVRARSRGSNYYAYVGTLIIEQTA